MHIGIVDTIFNMGCGGGGGGAYSAPPPYYYGSRNGREVKKTRTFVNRQHNLTGLSRLKVKYILSPPPLGH